MIRALGLLAALLLVCAAGPGPQGAPEGSWRAQLHLIPLRDAAGQDHLLHARVCRPKGEGRARVALINHGSPGNAAERAKMQPTHCEGEAAQWFLARGYLVVAAMRRGYGPTGGPWAEAYGACDRADYFAGGREAARDLAAVAEYAATLPFAQPDRMVVVGQSAGGWATMALAAAPPPPRVAALVNMAGGRGGKRGGQPNVNCSPDALVRDAGRFGATARLPMLWIYTENDSYFAPDLARRMHAAFTGAGGVATLQPLPAFGADGHGLFFGRGGSAIWGPLVERYLATR